MSRSTHSQWKSLADSADYLAVAPRTIRRYIAEGRLPASRVGPRQIRIRISDLDALMRPIPAAGQREAG